MSRKSNKEAAVQGTAASNFEAEVNNAAAAAVTSEEQAAAEQAAEDLKSEEAPAAKKNAKVVKSSDKVEFLTELIEEGKYTAAELTKMMLEKFPQMTEVTVKTFLTDSKNPRYNKFARLVTLSPEKKFIFVSDEKAA